MRVMDAAIISSKFRGSLLGVLIGDCCGAPFEGQILEGGEKLVLRKYFDKLEGPYFKAPQKKYTDDTVMTKCVLETLVEHRSINHKTLAKNFLRSYFDEPKRGYGGGVVSIFHKLRRSKLQDPLGPAKDQFNGTGSFGNGGAMRVAPVPLFCHNKTVDQLVEMAKDSALVTHTHRLGINGTILQALAIDLALKTTPTQDINAQSFIQSLIERMNVLEADKDELGLDEDMSGCTYGKQLQEVKRLLAIVPSDEEILNVLGHSVNALYSVPTAIYCFLRALNEIPDILTTNQFRRTLEYAISLGGDTDTIASMAGAISGAYHGDSVIAESIVKHCESSDEVIAMANRLYESSIIE